MTRSVIFWFCAVLTVTALLVRADPAEPPGTASLTLGRAALEDGLYDLAEKHLRAALTADPADESEIRLLLARALHGREEYAAMLDELDRIPNAGPTKTQLGSRTFWKAIAKYEMGRSIEANELIAEFEQEFPGHPDTSHVRRLRASCYLHLSEHEKAVEVFALLDREHADDPNARETRLEWAKTLLTLDRIPEARSLLSQLADPAQKHGIRIRALTWLGQIGIQQQEWDTAAAALEAITDDTNAPPDFRSRAWSSLAEIMEATNNLNGAAQALSSAIEQAPDDETRQSLQVVLGQILLRVGRLDDGIARLKEYIKNATDTPLAGALQLTLADALLENEDYERAAEEFQRYLETFADEAGTAQAHEGRGWALLRMSGRYAEAAHAFEKAYAGHIDEEAKGRSLFSAGDAYFANEQYSRATSAYESFTNEFGDSRHTPAAEYQIAECKVQTGETNAAERIFFGLADSNPGSSVAGRALLRAAELKQAEQKPFDAISLFDRVLETSTNSQLTVSARHLRGLAHYQLYRFEEALADFMTLQTQVTNETVRQHAGFMAGCSHYMLSRYSEALSAWSNIATNHTDSEWAGHARFWTGKHHWNQNQFALAETNFLGVATEYPEQPIAAFAWLRAGRAAMELKEFSRAAEHFAELARQHPERTDLLPEARFLQAKAKNKLGDYPDAILIYDEIINNYPEHRLVDRAWRRKGDIHFSLGASEPDRYKEAIAAFQKVIASPTAGLDLVLHAEYMIGRCLEQLDRNLDAFEQYYKVIVHFFEERTRGVWPNDEAKLWFSRAGFNAAELLAQEGKWRRAIEILRRIIDANVPASDEAQKQIEEILKKRWWITP
jgi:tetratricopeptide (TPR) repeat protein